MNIEPDQKNQKENKRNYGPTNIRGRSHCPVTFPWFHFWIFDVNSPQTKYLSFSQQINKGHFPTK